MSISILPALFSSDTTSCCVCNYVISHFKTHMRMQPFHSAGDVSLIVALRRFIRPN